MNKRDAQELFRRLAAVIDPRPELEYGNVFQLLVAVVLSAQATDRSVNQATRTFFPLRKTPRDFLEWGEDALREATRTIGLYRNKSRAIMGLCRKLEEEFGGEVPRDMASLMSLPGVGMKTAKVVLNVGFGVPVVAVDTHIFRVANRTRLAPAATPEEVSLLLEKRTPKEYLPQAHHYLLLHGRYVCTARAPHCDACPLADLCPERNTGSTK
ncbi:MAG: endonuclease III [Oligosphaeraceae bacterium]